ncbi:hypothetical protein AB0L70_38480 [Kribbella sp. NPDC051952]|uniref:hypothetical protein n=1 Tax=Kribbella sp. NPDC051952 TaxID=3154851 RepID=UPI003430D85B
MALGRRHPVSEDDVAAAETVMDLLATEALLALDKFERRAPSDDPARSQETANLLKYCWKELRLDEVELSQASDAQRILVAAAHLAHDPENKWGVTLQGATIRAKADTFFARQGELKKGIEDFRQDFEDSYGGRATVPNGQEWLQQSLTRLARASVLRDVVAVGAKVQMSTPVQKAADNLVQHGQKLTADRNRLAARQAAVDRGHFLAQQGSLTAGYIAYATSIDLTPTPEWVQMVLKAPAAAYMFVRTLEIWRQRDDVYDRVDSAQAQLRSVRTNATESLDGDNPFGRRDARTLGTARPRKDGPSR